MTVYRIDPATGRLTDVFTQDDDAPLPPDCLRIAPPVEINNPRWNTDNQSWEESSTQIIPGGNGNP